MRTIQGSRDQNRRPFGSWSPGWSRNGSSLNSQSPLKWPGKDTEIRNNYWCAGHLTAYAVTFICSDLMSHTNHIKTNILCVYTDSACMYLHNTLKKEVLKTTQYLLFLTHLYVQFRTTHSVILITQPCANPAINATNFLHTDLLQFHNFCQLCTQNNTKCVKIVNAKKGVQTQFILFESAYAGNKVSHAPMLIIDLFVLMIA